MTDLIYIASPYSHPDPAIREGRAEQATIYAARLAKQGKFFFAPITTSHPLTKYGAPETWDFWQRFDRVFMERCDILHVLMLDGWRESVGVQAEIKYFQDHDKPIRYVDPCYMMGTRPDEL